MAPAGNWDSSTPRTLLSGEVENSIGHTLWVKPEELSGWASRMPAPFRMRLKALAKDDLGDITGGYGIIVEPQHEYDQSFVVFKLHYQGIYNFTTSIGDYHVYLFPTLPKEWSEIATTMTTLDVPRTYSAAGYGRIGESK